MKPIPRLEPYLIYYVRSRYPHVPWLSIYRPLKGHTLAIAITNAYWDRSKKVRYRLIFEKDTDMPVEEYIYKVGRVLGYHTRMIVKTEHGFHVYTDIWSHNPYDIFEKMRLCYYYGLVDEGQLAEKRVESNSYENGFIMLRVTGKYLYRDLQIIMDRTGKDQWLKRVKKLLQAFT